jgi:hypothetical protein
MERIVAYSLCNCALLQRANPPTKKMKIPAVDVEMPEEQADAR